MFAYMEITLFLRSLTGVHAGFADQTQTVTTTGAAWLSG